VIAASAEARLKRRQYGATPVPGNQGPAPCAPLQFAFKGVLDQVRHGDTVFGGRVLQRLLRRHA